MLAHKLHPLTFDLRSQTSRDEEEEDVLLTWVIAEVDPPLLQFWVVPPVVLGTRQDALAVCHQQGVRGQARHLYPGQTLLVRRRGLRRQGEQLRLAVRAPRLRVWGRGWQTVRRRVLGRAGRRGLVIAVLLRQVVLCHHVAAVARWQRDAAEVKHGPAAVRRRAAV